MNTSTPTPPSSISIIIPALNEEAYLGETLQKIQANIDHLERRNELDIEVIVVNNGSVDRTIEIARENGATVIEAPKENVSTARNAGARAAKGDLLIFVDADTHWPKPLLSRIVEIMSDPKCIGGAVATEYHPKKSLIRLYLQFWRVLGTVFQLAQGATQFCRAEAFHEAGGYDSTVYMGEDTEFVWALKKLARRTKSRVEFIRDLTVVPSCRKFDKWPLWKTLYLTNPLVIMLSQRKKKPWGEWYENPTR